MVARTSRACPPPAGEVETTFVAAFERVRGWRVVDDVLVLLDDDEEELLRFAQAGPQGSWVATGILQGDAFRSPIVGTVVTATFAEPDTLRGSAGCNTYRATYAADRGAIEISAPAATRKACAEPEGVMEQEAAFLEGLASASRFRVDGAALEFVREDGTSVVHFTRG